MEGTEEDFESTPLTHERGSVVVGEETMVRQAIRHPSTERKLSVSLNYTNIYIPCVVSMPSDTLAIYMYSKCHEISIHWTHFCPITIDGTASHT